MTGHEAVGQAIGILRSAGIQATLHQMYGAPDQQTWFIQLSDYNFERKADTALPTEADSSPVNRTAS